LPPPTTPEEIPPPVSALVALREQISQLDKLKTEAVSKEDFQKAKLFKQQLEKLQASEKVLSQVEEGIQTVYQHLELISKLEKGEVTKIETLVSDLSSVSKAMGLAISKLITLIKSKKYSDLGVSVIEYSKLMPSFYQLLSKIRIHFG